MNEIRLTDAAVDDLKNLNPITRALVTRLIRDELSLPTLDDDKIRRLKRKQGAKSDPLFALGVGNYRVLFERLPNDRDDTAPMTERPTILIHGIARRAHADELAEETTVEKPGRPL